MLIIKKEGGSLPKEINLEYKNKFLKYNEVINKTYLLLNVR